MPNKLREGIDEIFREYEWLTEANNPTMHIGGERLQNLKNDIKAYVHQELQKVREEQNKHIGNQLLAYYENNVDPKGELKDKWFVKLVKNLADILVAPKDQSELDQATV